LLHLVGCLHYHISVNSTSRFLSPSVKISHNNLADFRKGFFLKLNLSFPKRTQIFLNSGTAHFQSHPEAKEGRAVGITALRSETYVLQWTFRVYRLWTEKLQQNYNPVTCHIKINKCKITLLIDFLCLLPLQPVVSAGMQLKTRTLTVAFRCPCDLYLTYSETRNVFRKIPEQMDAGPLHSVSHGSSSDFCKLADSSLFNDAVRIVSGQIIDPIFEGQAVQEKIYVQILNGRNILEEQGVGELIKLRRVFRKYDKG